MRVLIDADGCPVVRETVRQCAAFHVPCLLFCDTAHVFSIPGVEVFVADCGHDSTDYLLLSHLRPGDVVITQDYGLAAFCRKIPGLDESPKMWDNNKTTMIRLSDVRFPVPSCGRRSYL